MSKDEPSSLFCETLSSWGDHQNTPCSGFVKGPRFLNMVMPFSILCITEPRARFLLSLLEGIFIDFPSHFILSLIDVYRDTATHDKLIFPSIITRLLCHFFCLLSRVYTLFSYVCHRHGYCQMKQSPTSIEAAMDRDSNSSGFFLFPHLHLLHWWVV